MSNQKQKSFVLGTVFHTNACVRESAMTQGMGHGM